jgi:tetratricopeptide (TPR) repeat protein
MRKHSPAQRRRWQASLIIVLFFLAVVAAAGTGWWYARESPPHQGPLVLVSIETLSASQLRAYGTGETGRATPALDALVADSVLFAHAYTHSPQTLPANASLLTGRLPVEHGVRDDAGVVLTDDVRTLAEQLRSRGFTTGAAVSSFLLRREAGMAQGFTFFDAEMPEAAAGAPPAVTRDGLQTYETAERWMRSQRDQRYFLFLEIDAASADTVVARLVGYLKNQQLYDDASIVFTAAHGDNDPSAWLTDRVLAVPLVIKQPESDGAGRRVTAPVQHIDLLPTLLDLVRAPLPGGMRGRSLRPLLDAADAVIPPQPIYAESLEAAWRFGGAPVHAVTLDGFRITRGAGEEESIAWVGDTPQPPAQTDAKRAERLRAALDQFIDRPSNRAAVAIPAADASAYARAGYLPGLRFVDAASPIADPVDQVTVAAAHRSAVRLVGEGQYAAAIAALRGITRTHPDLAPVHLQIASLLARTGRVGEAVSAYEEAARIRPDDPAIATHLAAAHLRTQQVEQAMSSAQEAVALAEKTASPQSIAEAHEMAARVALAANDADAATTHAGAAQGADASLPLTAFVHGRLAYEDGQFDEALTAFQEALKTVHASKRELAELHLSLGDTLSQLDRHDEAEAEYREELRAFPDTIRAYSSLTLLYHASNRDDAAGETVDALLASAPTPEGYALAARLLTIVGQPERADAVKTEARRRFRGIPSASLN